MKLQSKPEIDEFIANRGGRDGTSSELIADIINKEKSSGYQHLVIVTEGRVTNDIIDESVKKMDEYGFSNSPFLFFSYIIGDGVDLSVGAPYCRDCPNKAYKINSSGTQELVSVDPKI